MENLIENPLDLLKELRGLGGIEAFQPDIDRVIDKLENEKRYFLIHTYRDGINHYEFKSRIDGLAGWYESEEGIEDIIKFLDVPFDGGMDEWIDIIEMDPGETPVYYKNANEKLEK